jgi:hypothetical protein
MLVSKPGTSKHELGNAVDIQQGKGDKQAIDALTQAGLKQPFPDKDPVHFEISARDGFDGVLDGPETGYKPDVTMHGKEQMTITPEKSKNDELLAAMIQRLDTMIEKYDEVITLLDDGNNHSKKLVTALA